MNDDDPFELGAISEPHTAFLVILVCLEHYQNVSLPYFPKKRETLKETFIFTKYYF